MQMSSKAFSFAMLSSSKEMGMIAEYYPWCSFARHVNLSAAHFRYSLPITILVKFDLLRIQVCNFEVKI
jgi:hypothetical protein